MSEVFNMLKGALGAVKENVQAVAPGLNAEKMASEIGATLKQKLEQGNAELAQGLMSHSNAYVPYGIGQQSPESHDHERGGTGR